ncbi:MAG: transposase [Muribaculaceae bacterium]|nr:transposase [Muribaculaceae bacterium]
MGSSSAAFNRKLAGLIPDRRNQDMIVHTYAEMVGQRVGQILCGYEDANDCDRLRDDSVLRMSVGRKPSDGAPRTIAPRRRMAARTRTLWFAVTTSWSTRPRHGNTASVWWLKSRSAKWART